MNVPCHVFGMKTQGQENCGRSLESADSLAWTYAAPYRPIRLDRGTHETCEYCPSRALRRRRLRERLGQTM